MKEDVAREKKEYKRIRRRKLNKKLSKSQVFSKIGTVQYINKFL